MLPDERKRMEIEVNIAKDHNPRDAGVLEIGDPSPFACPECHGVLLRLKAADPVRFRCHTGHGFSAHALVSAVNASIEEALWTAVRSLQEGAMLIEHLTSHVEGEDGERAKTLMELSRDARTHAERVREVLRTRKALAVSPP